MRAATALPKTLLPSLKPSYKLGFRSGLGVGAFVLVTFALGNWSDPILPRAVNAVLSALVFAVVVFLSIAVPAPAKVRFRAVHVDQVGISGRGVGGSRVYMRWDEIAYADPYAFSISDHPFVLLGNANRQMRLMLSRRLEEQDVFDAIVRTYLAPDHPLRERIDSETSTSPRAAAPA